MHAPQIDALTRCEVYSCDVGAVDTGPVFKVALLDIKKVLLHLLSGLGFGGHGVTADAGVVDQDAQAFLSRLDFLDKFRDVILGSDVETLQSHDLAVDVCAVYLDDAVQLVTGAASNVNFGAVHSKRLGDHQADTTASSSDQSNAALQVEETVAIEISMACCCDALRGHCGCLDAWE